MAGIEPTAIKEPPESVKDAASLWFWVCVMQLIVGVATGIEMISNPKFMSATLAQVKSQYGNQSDLPSDSLIMGVSGVLSIIGIAIVVFIFFILIKQFLKKRAWARFILIVGSAYLLVDAVTASFSIPDTDSQWYVWVNGIFSILSGIIAATAVWFATRSESQNYLSGTYNDSHGSSDS